MLKKCYPVLLSFLLVLSFSLVIQADTPITNVSTLANNSTVYDTNYYLLNSGDFTINNTSIINIYSSSPINSLRIDNASTNLDIAARGSVGLYVKNFVLGKNGGTLKSFGGTVNNAYGMLTNDGTFIQEGGSIESTGSTTGVSAAHGFLISDSTASLYDGTIKATAGSNRSHGFVVQTSNFTQYGGLIEANGGSNINTLATSTYGFSLVSSDNTFSQLGGKIVATGGSGDHGIGLHSHSRIIQEDGIIEARGGSGTESYGMYLLVSSTSTAPNSGGLIQNNGLIVASGGDGSVAYGLTLISNSTSSHAATINFVQNNGRIEASGGSLASSYGLYLYSYSSSTGASRATLTQNGGTIIATGGTFKESNGITFTAIGANSISSFIQVDGIFEAYGGEGITGSLGMQFYSLQNGTNELIQNKGTITARGGDSGESNLGISFLTRNTGNYNSSNRLTQNDGTIVATGGNGDYSHGLHLLSDNSGTGSGNSINTIVQNDGLMRLTGGSGLSSSGMVVRSTSTSNHSGITSSTFTQNGGTIVAFGGTGNYSNGLNLIGDAYSSTTFIQEGGMIFATGNGADTFGISLNNSSMIQNDGTIVARGGSGLDSAGISAIQSGTITQNGGILYALGGNSESSYGIYTNASTIMQMAGTIFASGGTGTDSYGILGDNFSTLSFAGHLEISRESVAASIFTNSLLTLKTGSILELVVDLAKSSTLASGNIIAGRVNIEETGLGATLSPWLKNTYKLSKGGSMAVNFIEIIPASPNVITGEFATLTPTITMDYTAALISGDKIYQLSITRAYTPKEAFENENNSGGSISQSDIDFVDRLYKYLVANGENIDNLPLVELLDRIDNSPRIADALDVLDELTISVPKNQIVKWDDTISRAFNDSQFSLNNKMDLLSSLKNLFWVDIVASFGKHGDTNEIFAGAAIGYVTKNNNVSYGLEVKFLDGDLETNEPFSNKSSFSLLAAINYNLHKSSLWNPKVNISVGYAFGIISNKISQNAFRASLKISNIFTLTDKIFIEPIVGVEYTPILFGGYSYESSPNVISDMPTTSLDSLNATLGGNIGFNLSEAFSAKVRGFVAYELFDIERRGGSENILALFVLNQSRFSWGLGVDAMYSMPSRGIAFDTSYTLYVRNDYISHHIKFGFNLIF